MKQFKELEKEIPEGYTNRTNEVQHSETRIVVSKKYADKIASNWINKNTGEQTTSEMCISLTYNQETETVRCIVSEAPPDLSSLINVFDDPNNKYQESGYWKEIISHNHRYDSKTGKINGWSLKKLFIKLEKEHITSPINKKAINTFNTLRSWICIKLVSILIFVMRAIPYKEKLDNGEYKANSFPLTSTEAFNNARIRISAYNGHRNSEVVDNEFKVKQVEQSMGLSIMTFIAFLTFIAFYIPIQLFTCDMSIPSIMIVNPDWTFIQLIFAIWVSIVYVSSYFLAYPIAKWLHRYIILK